MYYFEEEFVNIDKYNFDNLIITNNNQLVFNACNHIYENIKKKIEYNPLFITGPKGCGKTHMLQGLANKIIDNKGNNINLKYINMENFIIDIIEIFKNKRNSDIDKLKNYYKNLDLLIIDDFENIEGKQGTQNIFFEIFNFLQSNNKKIIIASKYSVEIMNLYNKNKNEVFNKRLLSRLQWGLSVEFKSYNYESIVAILTKKTEKYDFNQEIINYLAQNLFTDNIRELEGIITKLIAISISMNKDITIEMVEKILKQEKRIGKKNINIDDIINVVVKYYNISKRQLLSKNRSKEYSNARSISIWLATEYTNMGLNEIGKYYENRGHASIIYARNKIKELIKKDDKYKKIVNDLKKMLINK